MAPSDLLTIDEAAEFTRWTKATLYSKVSRRQIPSVRLGRSIRFRRRDLLNLLRDVPTVTPSIVPTNGTGVN